VWVVSDTMETKGRTMNRLDVYATKCEIAQAKRLLETAQTTPVIAMSMAHGINEGGFAGQAWTRVHDYVAEIAKAHDLPDIEGQYGIDLETGQFLQ